MELHLIYKLNKLKETKLGHGESSSAHAETNTLRSKLLSIATSAVNLAIRCVVQISRVQRASAINAAEAPSVPEAILANHLFGSIDSVSATTAALAWWGFHSRVGSSFVVNKSGSAVSRNESWGVTVTKTFGPKESSVAGATVNFLVRSIAS